MEPSILAYCTLALVIVVMALMIDSGEILLETIKLKHWHDGLYGKMYTVVIYIIAVLAIAFFPVLGMTFYMI